MSHSARLAELGIALPTVPAPVAAYVPATISGGQVLTAGQLPFVDGKLTDTGKVGAQVSPERAAELARTPASPPVTCPPASTMWTSRPGRSAVTAAWPTSSAAPWA